MRWPIGGTPPTAYPVAVRTNAGLGLARHLDPSSRACHVWVVVRGRDRVVPIPVKVMADQVAVLELRHVPVGNLDAPGGGVGAASRHPRRRRPLVGQPATALRVRLSRGRTRCARIGANGSVLRRHDAPPAVRPPHQPARTRSRRRPRTSGLLIGVFSSWRLRRTTSLHHDRLRLPYGTH